MDGIEGEVGRLEWWEGGRVEEWEGGRVGGWEGIGSVRNLVE